MKIEKITIEGYKSIKSLRDFELKNINILIGANGVGKSNFISVFKMVNYMLYKRLQEHTQDKGPDSFLYFGRKITNQILLDFAFGSNGYDVTLIPTQNNQLLIKREHVRFKGYDYINTIGCNMLESHLMEAPKYAYSQQIAQYTLDAIRSWKLYHFHDTGETSPIKGVCQANDNIIFKANAQNISAYLKRLKDDYLDYYEKIVSTIQDVAPFFGGFILRDSDYIQLEWYDKSDPDTPFKAHMLSDGTLRFICLATLLLQPFELMPDTIIIDEPELGLHPFAINILSTLIKRVAERKQIIISSQSVELINYFTPEDIIVVDRKNKETVFRRLKEEELGDWLQDYTMGEIWKSNLIGGRP